MPRCTSEPPPKLSKLRLCRSHYNRMYVSGWTLAEMLAADREACAIDSCANPATQLDHDHSCCNSVLHRKRCGRCNRGMLCAECNRHVGMVERQTSRHAERIPRERLAEIRTYVAHWSELQNVAV